MLMDEIYRCISKKDLEKLNEWIKEQDRKVAEKQGGEEPYYGACGGELSWIITPTSLFTAIKVKHALTNEVLDLTDYDDI